MIGYWWDDNPDGPLGPPVDAVACRVCKFWFPCSREQASDVLSAHAVAEHPDEAALSGFWMAAGTFRTGPPTDLSDLGVVRA